MVYCKECGTSNDDTAEYCINCGSTLRARAGRDECFGTSRRAGRDECFGIPQGGSIVGIIFGIMIILVGAKELMGWNFDFGPFMIIIVGILIVAGTLYQMRSRKRSE